jgi:hypothetical protein
MKTKLVPAGVFVALTLFAIAANAFYDAPSPTKLEGVISDFSPQSTTPVGPYLVNGPWSLQFQPSGKASFSASLTMVRSDLWFVNTPGSDPNSQADRNFHTHHVQVTDAQVALVGTTIVVTGAAFVTSSGNQVFPGSGVQVEITGGNTVSPSNIKLIFVGPVTAHFTSEPYEGVVVTP